MCSIFEWNKSRVIHACFINAYCEVTYYEGSEFGIHYKIYDKQDGTLLQQN